MQSAIELLKSPETWCRGADMLAKQGDKRALLPLLGAYEARIEGSRACLLNAMEALNAVQGAADLFAQPETRRLAVHLMELFPDESHLDRLVSAVADADPGVRAQARRSLITQKQTPAWEAAMIGLLQTGDAQMQEAAAKSLARRKSDAAQQALQAYQRR